MEEVAAILCALSAIAIAATLEKRATTADVVKYIHNRHLYRRRTYGLCDNVDNKTVYREDNGLPDGSGVYRKRRHSTASVSDADGAAHDDRVSRL